MAGYTIEKRKTSKDELRYRCTVREHKGEAVVYRESRIFGRQSDAKSWGMQMVTMIECRAKSQLVILLYALSGSKTIWRNWRNLSCR